MNDFQTQVIGVLLTLSITLQFLQIRYLHRIARSTERRRP